MIGSLFTLAGETLSAIGRMIERPGFNDEAAEAYLSESAVINKATADTLRASMGRMESDGPDAADVLADAEESVEVFEPCNCYAPDRGGHRLDCPHHDPATCCACGPTDPDSESNGPAIAFDKLNLLKTNPAAYFHGDPSSVADPDPRRNAPTPPTPPAGLGHPTSLGPVDGSQQLTGGETGEAVDATEHGTSGGGVDRPLSEVLIEVCDVLRGLTSTPLSMTAWLSYRNDALILMPVLQDAADKLRDTG